MTLRAKGRRGPRQVVPAGAVGQSARVELLPSHPAAWLAAGGRVLALLGLLAAALLGAFALLVRTPGRSHRGPLPAPDARHRLVEEGVRGHVEALAGRIGPRDLLFHPESLREAAEYVAGALSEAGWEVRRHAYEVDGEEVVNLDAERRGDLWPDQILVVGAHYDSRPSTPGADDNASGVAALVEVARLLQARPLRRTLRLVAFVNEEPPHFRTGTMGSLVYARACAGRGERIVGMFALEMLGCYDDAPGTQFYPPPLSLFYPDRGDFVAFVSDLGSRRLLRRAVATFRRHVPFPSEALAAPAAVPGVDLSDHWSFRQAGYPAVMVTDTAYNRNDAYHLPADRPDTLDYGRLARVTAGLAELFERLANAERL